MWAEAGTGQYNQRKRPVGLAKQTAHSKLPHLLLLSKCLLKVNHISPSLQPPGSVSPHNTSLLDGGVLLLWPLSHHFLPRPCSLATLSQLQKGHHHSCLQASAHTAPSISNLFISTQKSSGPSGLGGDISSPGKPALACPPSVQVPLHPPPPPHPPHCPAN